MIQPDPDPDLDPDPDPHVLHIQLFTPNSIDRGWEVGDLPIRIHTYDPESVLLGCFAGVFFYFLDISQIQHPQMCGIKLIMEHI